MLIFSIGTLNLCYSQSLKSESQQLAKTQGHSVKKATWYSAALPGLGQAYNRKYWKIPIVYAALGTTIYFARQNHVEYRKYLDAFYLKTDSTRTETNILTETYTASQLIELQDIYRKWRDLNLILTGFVYALQIIDAHVDAHLFYYDVSDDLTLRWEPTLIQSPQYQSIGISLKLNLR